MAQRRAGAPTANRSLQDVAYDELKQRIVSGEYPPGSFLSARELADQLSMSKTPVHAALGRLAEQGYVTISPQRGAVVRALTFQEVVDHYDVRAALESYAVRQLAGRLPEEYRARLERNLQEQAACVEQLPDVGPYISCDVEFHWLLCEATGNREFARIMLGLGERLRRVMRSTWTPEGVLASHADHQLLFGYILDADAEAAAELMDRHIGRHLGSLSRRVGQTDPGPRETLEQNRAYPSIRLQPSTPPPDMIGTQPEVSSGVRTVVPGR
jgi:GntR family transcriptional regulator, rspAB operon transcriptional repressor